MARAVVRHPDDTGRGTAVQARGDQACHGEFDVDLRVIDVGDDRVSDDRHGEGDQHKRTAQLVPIGQDGHGDGEDRRHGVGNDGPELRRVRRVAQALDDRRQEDADRIDAGQHGDVRQGGQPGLEVQQASSDLGPAELLGLDLASAFDVRGRVDVQPGRCVFPFLGREEPGGGDGIGQERHDDDAHDHGQEALDQHDPAPARVDTAAGSYGRQSAGQ